MGRKILVVDDEKLIVKGIHFSLIQDGFDVDCAYDGAEALAMAKHVEYEVILLDVMLPEMDGFTVCQQIHNHKQKHQPHVGILRIVNALRINLNQRQQKYRHQGIHHKGRHNIHRFIQVIHLQKRLTVIFIQTAYLMTKRIGDTHHKRLYL